jgi:hypothetical protein
MIGSQLQQSSIAPAGFGVLNAVCTLAGSLHTVMRQTSTSFRSVADPQNR